MPEPTGGIRMSTGGKRSNGYYRIWFSGFQHALRSSADGRKWNEGPNARKERSLTPAFPRAITLSRLERRFREKRAVRPN